MRPTSALFTAAIALALLAACGTKTPLTLPPPQPEAKPAAAPAAGVAPAAGATTERRP